MAGKGTTAQRDELIEVELRNIREMMGEIKMAVTALTADLGTVRLAELTAIREKISAIEGDMKVLTYQSRKSGAWSGLFAGAGVSAIVAALAALLLKH